MMRVKNHQIPDISLVDAMEKKFQSKIVFLSEFIDVSPVVRVGGLYLILLCFSELLLFFYKDQ